MTGCLESGSSLAYRQLDATFDALVPALTKVLERAVAGEDVRSESDGSGYRFVAPVRFPDGIGRGSVIAQIFPYRDRLRIDIELVHNRMLARSDGSASERRCYLNDYVASTTLPIDARELTADFMRDVIRGIRLAKDGVQRYNREQAAPWSRISVAPATD
jgi:hypothetical protein